MWTRVVCALLLCSALMVQAEESKSALPAQTPPPVTESAPATPMKAKRPSAQIKRRCKDLLTALTAAAPDAETSAALIREKRQLDLTIADAVAAKTGVARDTQVQDMQLFERALSLLGRGNVDELVALIQPLQRTVFDSARAIQMSTKEIARLKAASTEANAEAIAQNELIFQRASVPFGENYGSYIMLASLLESVAEGNGVGTLSPIPLQRRDGATSAMMFDLDSKTAVNAAKRIRGILNPRVESQWTPHLQEESYAPSLEELRTLFRSNIFALLAKLRQDQKKEQLEQRWWVKSLRYIADAYMNVTSTTLFPERYRKWVLRLTGIAYDQFMLNRYLDKVQAVVEVARVRTQAGEVVLSTDKDTLDLQIKTLMEFDSQAIGDDFLITFARIGYHTDSWANIMGAIKEKATIDPKTGLDANSPYTLLYNRMVASQKRAADLGGLTYIYEPVVAYKAVFASLQIAYLLGTEEATRHILWPYFSHLLHFLN